MNAASAKLREWRENPISFVREVFRVEPDEWQKELLAAFPANNRLAAKACKGPGKTATAAWLGWNFLLTRPHCKVPCTSITGDNLKDGLWTEFAKWRNRSQLLKEMFEWTSERIFARQHPETWWASARRWSKDADASAQANTLAGLHEDYQLFIIDECSDIPDGVVSAAEASLTGGIETKLLMLGNPTRTDGPLWRACTTERGLWFIVEITGDPDDPKRSPRIDPVEARRQIDKWGADNPWVLVNIYGRFPPAQSDKLLGPDDCGSAANRSALEAAYASTAKVLAVDCARFGNDRSVIFPRQGVAAFRYQEFRNLDTCELGDQVIRYADKWDPDAVFVDEGGLGAGVVDHCNHHGLSVIGVNFGARPADPDRFENKRAEMWWDMAQWVKGGGCIPNSPELISELTSPTYWFDKKQRVCLESKDDIKARLGRSPDIADALCMTFSSPVSPRPQKDRADLTHLSQQAIHEYDPLRSAHG